MDLSRIDQPAVRHAGVGVLFLVGIVLSGYLMRSHAEERSQDWLRNLRYADTTTIVVEVPAELGSTGEVARLREQLQEIQARARFHLSVVTYFYGRYFSSISRAALLAIVAAVCLLHITKRGWDNANSYVITIFVLAAGAAVLFRVSPALYRQDENITRNKELYTHYINLDNTIRTYIATNRVRNQEAPLSLADFLLFVDGRLQDLNDLPIGFDETQIPNYQGLEFAPGATGTGPRSP